MLLRDKYKKYCIFFGWMDNFQPILHFFSNTRVLSLLIIQEELTFFPSLLHYVLLFDDEHRSKGKERFLFLPQLFFN